MKPRVWKIAGAILTIVYGFDLVTEWFRERKVSFSNMFFFHKFLYICSSLVGSEKEELRSWN